MGRHQTVYKRLGNNKVAVLGIPTAAKTNEKRRGIVNKTYARYKTNKAIVRRIYDASTKENCDTGIGLNDPTCTFTVGSYVESNKFNRSTESSWNEMNNGFDYVKCKSIAELHGTPVVNGLSTWYTDTSYDPVSGRAKIVHNIKNGKYHGKQITYDNNGNMTSKVNYVDGVLHGEKKIWNNGLLTINDAYDNNQLVYMGFTDVCCGE